MSGPLPGIRLRRILCALSKIQRSAASGGLVVRGEGGGVVAFHRGVVSRVLGGTDAAAIAEAHAPQSVHRSSAIGILRAALNAEEGATFHPDASESALPGSAGAPGRLTAGDLILDLVRAAADPSWVENEIGSAPLPIGPNPSPPQIQPAASFTPAEGFLMSRADGTLTIREILAISPLLEQDTFKTIYGLLAAGMIVLPGHDVLSEGPPAGAPAAGAAAEPPSSQPPAKPKISALDAFLRRTGEEKAPAPAAGAGTYSIAPSVSAERESLLQRMAEQRGADHYHVLGVEKNADENAVRRAYYKIAKRYHPDRFRRPEFDDILTDIEAMFAATTEAYNTLTDDKARPEYDRALAENSAGPRAPEVDRAASARESYLRARKHLESEELYDALRLLETACQTDPSKHEYFYYLGVVQTRNPRWRKKAEQSFLKVIEMSPSHTQAYLQLGRLYKSGGLARRAMEMFEKILEWEPENEDALTELDRKKAQDTSSTGRIRSMFKGQKP